MTERCCLDVSLTAGLKVCSMTLIEGWGVGEVTSIVTN